MRSSRFEYPKHLLQRQKKAKILEYCTLVYLTIIIISYMFIMGNSKIMQANFYEDLLSFIPPLSFLITAKIFYKKPTKNFPYGFHKVVSIAFFFSAIALCSMGLMLLIENSIALIKQDHVSIGTLSIFGYTIWQGYAMIFLMCWKIIVPAILGHKKFNLAKQLHDKTLYTDAEMNKADWLTASGSILGIIGIGYGFWWLDALIALFISFDILYDGSKNLIHAIEILMDKVPTNVANNKTDSLISETNALLKSMNWIETFATRFREAGHVYFVEIFVQPKNFEDIIHKIETTEKSVCALNWKIFEVVVILKNKIGT